MNMELYRTFYFVAKCGSISKASEQLYITQPAVSRAIRQLEDALDCPLFVRTSKGVKLTQEGEILSGYVEQAFSFISLGERKVSDVRNLLSGEIRIGASDTICKHYLTPFLKLFNTLHPQIRIHVICPTTPVIISLLKAGKIDIGIINLPYEDENLESKSILDIQDCFVGGQKYRHLSNKLLPLSEIVGNPMLLLERGSNSRQYLDRYFKAHDVTVVPDFELGNMDLLVNFAKYDFGIACVIRNFVEEELESGKLFEIRPIEKLPARSLGVVWLKDSLLSKASEELITYFDSSTTAEF
jgi:DNA-binding transcriptional LysR family regulator